MKCNGSHSCWTGPANIQRRRVGWMRRNRWHHSIVPTCVIPTTFAPPAHCYWGRYPIQITLTLYFFNLYFSKKFFFLFSAVTISPSHPSSPTQWTPCYCSHMTLPLSHHHPVFSSSLTFSHPSFISDVREEKETGSASPIGQEGNTLDSDFMSQEDVWY